MLGKYLNKAHVAVSNILSLLQNIVQALEFKFKDLALGESLWR
jgi:hypothetical protein